MFERCKVEFGAKMLKKFFEPGFLNLCNGELLKSLAKPPSFNKCH
jgi:hypothetical protein